MFEDMGEMIEVIGGFLVLAWILWLIFKPSSKKSRSSNQIDAQNSQAQISPNVNATDYCPECGAVAEKDDVFCVNCGKKL